MTSNRWNTTFIVATGTLLAFIVLISHSRVATAQDRCDQGYVWREAFPRDYACVTPDVREQAQRDNAATASRYAPGAYGPDTCLTPFVWRDAFPGDKVCVTTSARDQARYENQLSANRRSPTGGPYGPDTCKPGFVWREASPNDHVCVEPGSRQRVREENARADANRGSNICKPGYVWREASPSDYVCVEPAVREQARRDNAAYNTQERVHSVICDQYAREAVAQFHEMQARNCGFSGNRWSDNYDGHSVWCQTAAPRDRNGEAGARRKQLRDCGARAPSQGSPLPNEQCSVSVVVRNRSCLNADGTPSSLTPGASTASGCGGNVENARARAKLSFASAFGCISDDDSPLPGCCTVSEETVGGCLCR